MFLMQNEATAIGASKPVKVSDKIQNHMVEVTLNSTGTTKISACTVELQGGSTKTETCVSTAPSLAVGSTAQRIANSLFYYQINGTNYTIATDAVGAILTDVKLGAQVQTIAAGKFGGLVVCAGTAGTIRTISPIGGVAGEQAYDTAVECNAALDLVAIPKNWCYIGKLVVTDAGGGTTFGTTALTAITTFYDASCPYSTVSSYPLSAADITAQRGTFSVSGEKAQYMRTYMSALTGAGKITIKYLPFAR